MGGNPRPPTPHRCGRPSAPWHGSPLFFQGGWVPDSGGSGPRVFWGEGVLDCVLLGEGPHPRHSQLEDAVALVHPGSVLFWGRGSGLWVGVLGCAFFWGEGVLGCIFLWEGPPPPILTPRGCGSPCAPRRGGERGSLSFFRGMGSRLPWGGSRLQFLGVGF